MNFTEFQVQLRCCLIIKSGFDNEWMNDFYADYKEDFGIHRSVREWAEDFFQDVTLDTHSYCLVTKIANSLNKNNIETQSEWNKHHYQCECAECIGTVVKNEYILCAAIYFNDGIKHDHQPKNIETGFVVTGRRHHNCYATLSAIAKSINLEERIRLLINKTDRDKQGFITNLDRYVDRKEGYQIATKSNQLLHNLHDKSNPILISEDLY